MHASRARKQRRASFQPRPPWSCVLPPDAPILPFSHTCLPRPPFRCPSAGAPCGRRWRASGSLLAFGRSRVVGPAGQTNTGMTTVHACVRALCRRPDGLRLLCTHLWLARLPTATHQALAPAPRPTLLFVSYYRDSRAAPSLPCLCPRPAALHARRPPAGAPGLPLPSQASLPPCPRIHASTLARSDAGNYIPRIQARYCCDANRIQRVLLQGATAADACCAVCMAKPRRCCRVRPVHGRVVPVCTT